MKTKKHLLLVRSGYPSKEFVLKRLQELDYHVIVLDKEVNCPPNLVNEWIFADLTNIDECVSAVNKYLLNSENKIDGVVTFWEEAVLVTSAISDALNLPGIPVHVASKIKNKYFFRDYTSQNNLPTPSHQRIKTLEDIEKIEKNLTYPLVIKPIYGAASAFVVKVENKYEFIRFFKYIQRYIENFWLAPEWENLELYVEEYIDGSEVDIDILVQDGKVKFLSITDNFGTEEPFFVETGQAIPSSLSPKKQKELEKMAITALKKLEVNNGCIHFEAKSTENGPMPIEINLRMGGDEVYFFVKEAWGVDMVEYAAKIATGQKINVKKPKKPIKFLAGSYFLPERSGIVTNISIDSRVIYKKYLEDINLAKKVGDAISIPPEDYDALGWVTVSGKDSVSAMLNLYEALKYIKIKVTPIHNRYEIQANI